MNITTKDLIDKAIHVLTEAERRMWTSGIAELVEANNRMHHVDATSFTYVGKVYVDSQSKLVLKRGVRGQHPALHFTLQRDMQNVLEGVERLRMQLEKVRQSLFNLLYQTNNIQEVRDVLPDVIANLLPATQNVPRRFTQEAMFRQLNLHKRVLSQYYQALQYMETLAATRLIY